MKVAVRAPATVANLGAGFDCLAMAVDLRNEFTVDLDGPPGVRVHGEAAGELPEDGTNLVFRTISSVVREAGGRLSPFALSCETRIPLQRGLGSSATAVVAGVLLADHLLGLDLDPARLLEAAIDLEGHADNVAACLRGGLVLVFLSSGGWRTVALDPHPSLRPVLLVPDGERMSTKDARRVIPTRVPLADATFNVSRSALAMLALTERPELLQPALEDRLHQPYRLPAMPASRALLQDLREEGFAVCVAGSGPTLLAFEDEKRRIGELGPGWRVLRPAIAPDGATIVEHREEAVT